MKAFEEIKEELLQRAKEKNACQTGYKMGLEAQSKQDLLEVITRNWVWVLRDANIVDAKYLEDNFTEEDLAEAGIYTKKFHEVRTASFACGNATVEAYGKATVKACGNATVKACDNATVIACDSATVEACGNATVIACDSATVEACGNATVEAYGKATVKACGKATVKACDSATVEAYNNSYVEDYTGKIRPKSDYAIVKDYYSRKIYIKKGKFKIIEVD